MNTGILLSIVTIVLNDEKGIKRTMDSVEAIISNSIEHIIIDGKSADSTINIIKSKEYKLKLISESDNGIYDAMNKGVKYASGKYIQFLNAGDSLNENFSIEYLLDMLKSSSNTIFYGNTLLQWKNKVKLKKYNNVLNFDFGLPFNHQSCFTPRTILKKTPFDSDLKILGDLKLYEELYFKNIRFKYLDIIVANYDMNGISSTYSLSYLYELKTIKNYSFQRKWLIYLMKYGTKCIRQKLMK